MHILKSGKGCMNEILIISCKISRKHTIQFASACKKSAIYNYKINVSADWSIHERENLADTLRTKSAMRLVKSEQ